MNDQTRSASTQASIWPPWLADVEAVLLDMDGTLVDSDAAVERAWGRWAAEHGVDASTLAGAMHGRPALATVRELAPWLDDAAAQQAADRQIDLQILDVNGTAPLAGAAELLGVLDRFGMPWAVVTSANGRLAAGRLGAAGIEPVVLVTVDDVGAGKPDPGPYLLAASQLGVDPSRCLVVEDSPPGIEAGRRAGARVAALRGRPADLTIDSLSELAALFEVGHFGHSLGDSAICRDRPHP
jgi:HAD superfamily hydrolase (TIGR01509 family)